MHHFHPERRADAVAFVNRLLKRDDVFPVDHLAGILCDCADSGLTELAEPAEQFAARMDDKAAMYPMATAIDVRRAFRDGAQADFITGRPHDVYAVNKQWERWARRQESEREKSSDRRDAKLISAAEKIFSKVGRNEPCPCGSGKKFKKCHGK